MSGDVSVFVGMSMESEVRWGEVVEARLLSLPLRVVISCERL